VFHHAALSWETEPGYPKDALAVSAARQSWRAAAQSFQIGGENGIASKLRTPKFFASEGSSPATRATEQAGYS